MELGISSYSFPWSVGIPGHEPEHPLTVHDLLDLALQLNVQVIQFGDNLPLHHLSIAELEALKARADSRQLRLEVGARRLAPEVIALYLYIAQVIGSPFLRLVIDDEGFHPSEGEVVEKIRELLPSIRSSGVRLAIENHDRFPAQSLRRILEATDPHWVGICLDTANSLGAGEGLGEIVPVLAPYTLNLHIKDFRIQRVDHKMGFTVSGCPAGQGQVDVPALIEALAPYGRCQTAILELWSDPEPSPAQTLARERQWVEQSMAYLKGIWEEVGFSSRLAK